MGGTSRTQRERHIQFALGMAAIDGGKPTTFTQQRLQEYRDGRITAGQLRRAIIRQYTKGR